MASTAVVEVQQQVVAWDQITAECDGYRAGFVAVFRKYEGQATDEKDAQGRTVKVSAASFARHNGISETSFKRWLDRQQDDRRGGAGRTVDIPGKDADKELRPGRITIAKTESEVERSGLRSGQVIVGISETVAAITDDENLKQYELKGTEQTTALNAFGRNAVRQGQKALPSS